MERPMTDHARTAASSNSRTRVPHPRGAARPARPTRQAFPPFPQFPLPRCLTPRGGAARPADTPSRHFRNSRQRDVWTPRAARPARPTPGIPAISAGASATGRFRRLRRFRRGRRGIPAISAIPASAMSHAEGRRGMPGRRRALPPFAQFPLPPCLTRGVRPGLELLQYLHFLPSILWPVSLCQPTMTGGYPSRAAARASSVRNQA
jgi:hypothetical protein